MILPDDLKIELHPQFPMVEGVNFARLLGHGLRCGFELTPYQAVITEMVKRGELQRAHLRSLELSEEQLLLSEEVYFPRQAGWNLTLAREIGRVEASIELDTDDVSTIAEMLRLAACSSNIDEFRDYAADLGEELLDVLLRPSMSSRPRWRRAKPPGIYRREHASLLIRSATTSILFDPVSRGVVCPDSPHEESDESIDAVVITHEHGDHIHWPSTLCAARSSTTPVYVPVVPRVNLLTHPRFSDSGRALGQRVEELPWHSAVTVGDIQIRSLPFYGEQPTAYAPGPVPDLRSWGNCYRITTPQFSLLLLVDSGRDPMGGMDEVVARSVSEDGPVDFVASCLREFSSPFFGGLSTYFATLSLARLRELYAQHVEGKLPSTTAGPKLVAQLCGISGAKYFLPYAHGFEGFGVPIQDIGWDLREGSEEHVGAQLSHHLLSNGTRTQCVRWAPGESAHLVGGQLEVRKASPALETPVT